MVFKALRLFVTTAAILVAALPAAAQSTTGTITGRALDSSGGILPGVDVSISSPAMIGGPRQAVTDSLGVNQSQHLLLLSVNCGGGKFAGHGWQL